MSRRVRIEIYVPTHFRKTWEKFKEILERDGTTPSAELRKWIEGYVHRKDPGNPQRPLTAYVPGHEDQESLEKTKVFAFLREYACARTNEVRFRDIVQELRARDVEGPACAAMADSIARDLRESGVDVLV